MATSKTILLLLAVGAVLLMQHYYPLIPDPMASHFDGAGRPNGYQSRDGFFLLSGAMLLLVVALFGGIGLLFRVMPTRWYNLPNRDYWLSLERRVSTIDFMTRQIEWFGIGTLILVMCVLWIAMEANLTPDRTIDSTKMWWLLGAYLTFGTVWLVRFVRTFRRSPQ